MLPFRLRSEAKASRHQARTDSTDSTDIKCEASTSTGREFKMSQGNDSILLPKFIVGMEPYSWLERWESYMKLVKKPKDEEKPEWFALYLGDGLPSKWFSGLSADQKASFTEIRKSFIDNFVKSDTDRFTVLSQLANRKQRSNEPVLEFVSTMQHQASIHKIEDDTLINYLVQNFLPYIQQDVIKANPKTLPEVIQIAKNSEAAFNISKTTANQQTETVSALVDVLRQEFGSLTAKVDQSLQTIASIQKQEFRHIGQNSRHYQRQDSNFNTPRQLASQTHYQKRHNTHKANKDYKCFSCDSTDHFRQDCPHKNKVCNFCKKEGHLQRACLKLKSQ